MPLASWLAARSRLLSFRHSPLSSFVPRSAFFLFHARSTVKDVWQNLNCETSVGRPARKPEASSPRAALSLSHPRFFSFRGSFSLAYTRITFASRAFVSGRIIFCHRAIIKISAIMMLSPRDLSAHRLTAAGGLYRRLILAMARPDGVATL